MEFKSQAKKKRSSSRHPLSEDERLAGTIREVSPDVTLARILPIAARIGITRVANITGLDSVGVPVWIAIRPLSKSLSVSQGKGMTDKLAQCSGIMESIELYHAENVRPPGRELALTAYADDIRFIHPGRLPLHVDADFSDDRTVYWVRGIDIVSSEERWIPHELFDLDSTTQPNRAPLFLSSSNGLASGNSYAEAVLHGLCEAIERDQVSLWLLEDRLKPQKRPTRLNLESVTDPSCRKLIEQCRHAELEIFVWYATIDIGVPVFVCVVADQTGHTAFRQRASGSGCHPTRAIALSRAITEALQSRLTHISGVRDDVDWRKYREDIKCSSETLEWISEMRSRSDVVEFASIQEVGFTDDISQLLEHTKKALEEGELPEIVVVDLTSPKFSLPVVYVCVPDLEFSALKPSYSPGKRMLRILNEEREPCAPASS